MEFVSDSDFCQYVHHTSFLQDAGREYITNDQTSADRIWHKLADMLNERLTDLETSAQEFKLEDEGITCTILAHTLQRLRQDGFRVHADPFKPGIAQFSIALDFD